MISTANVDRESSRARFLQRVAFAREALPIEEYIIFKELEGEKDEHEQEILLGKWVETFFHQSKTTWKGFASIPLMEGLSLSPHWKNRRLLWDYLLYFTSQVESIYFYYDRFAGPDFVSEEIRLKGTWRREEARPWLQLALHGYRDFLPLLEDCLPLDSKAEKELIFRLMWTTAPFGKWELKARTRLQLRHWAGEHQRLHTQVHTIPNHNQLGLFKA